MNNLYNNTHVGSQSHKIYGNVNNDVFDDVNISKKFFVCAALGHFLTLSEYL